MEWNTATQVSDTLVSVGLNSPQGLAVDTAGNVYIADSSNAFNGGSGAGGIEEWNAATQTLSTLVSAGLINPFGVAVNALGNVYIADGGPMFVLSGSSSVNAIKEWNTATQMLSTLLSPVTTQGGQFSMAVDRSGNVYFVDTQANELKEWSAATQTVSTLVSSGLSDPTDVWVDATGNVYITENDGTILEWNAATQTLVTPASSSGAGSVPVGTVVDASGNVYAVDSGSNQITETPRAYVSDSPFSEGSAAGSGALAVVPPAGESLTGILAPRSSAVG